MHRSIILAGYVLALVAAALWLVELTGHEATKRKLTEAQKTERGLRWVIALQNGHIGILETERSFGEALITPLREFVDNSAAVFGASE
jgi:hypothetical protein